MARSKLDLTDDRQSPFKVIILLAWPLFVEQILSTLVTFADNAMVGQIGIHATAAVTISNPFVFLLNGVVLAMGVGLTAYIARSVGAKDYEAAKSYIRHAFLLLLYIGLPIALILLALHRMIPQWMGAEPEVLDDAATYLLITSVFRIFTMAMMVLGSVFRGRGDTKTPLRINILTNLLNITGNYLLINPCHTITIPSLTIPFANITTPSFSFEMIGAGMGVAGAALSTGISWLVGGGLLAIMLFVKKDPTRISLRDSFTPDFTLIRRVLHLSIPAMLERLCMSSASIFVTKCISTLGTVAIGANSVYLNAESLSYMPAFAFATAATTLVGQALGAKKPKLAEKYAWCTIALGVIIMTAAGICLYVFDEQLVRIITPDVEAIALASVCLRIAAFIQPVQASAWIFAGALRGAGDTKWPFLITMVCNWSIRVLFTWLFITKLGLTLPYAVFATCVDNAFRCLLTFLRFKSGRWKNVIKEPQKSEESCEESDAAAASA